MLDIQTDNSGEGRLCSPDPLHLQHSVQRTLVLRQAAHLLRLQIGACQHLASMVIFDWPLMIYNSTRDCVRLWTFDLPHDSMG
jgi:hypothetical protein